MEFWGIAVKPGETVRVDPGDETYLHLSQTSLGEIKKDKICESVTAFVKVDDKKLVIGTLSGEKCPQISHDLVFNDELELSHSSKSTTLYFLGYKAQADGEEPGSSDTDSETDNEAIELAEKANGKPDLKEGIKASKLLSGKGEGSSKKSKAKAEDLKAGKSKQDGDDDDDSESDEEDFDEDESDSGDEDMIAAGDSSDEDGEDDSSDEEDEATPKKEEAEATPKKAEISKKRGADSATKTPVPEKKTKLISPSGSQKTGGGKKSVHTATPYPTKQAAKTPANTGKSKPKTPKSGGSGSIACKACSKTFNSDVALQSHTKAKHEAK